MLHRLNPVSYLEKTAQSSSIRLLDRFYGLFFFLCAIVLTIGAPFVFFRKAASAVIAVLMMVAVFACWQISRRGQPQKSLILFAAGMWLVLMGVIVGGLPAITAATAMAVAVMLAVVVHLRAGVFFGIAYLVGWLVYIGLQVVHLAPAPYFTGAPLTGWFIGAVAFWLVLLPAPGLVQDLRKAASLQRAVIEATADGILVVNNQGHVATHNQRFADLWRIPPELLNTGNDRDLLDFVAQQLVDPDQFLQKVQELYAHPDLTSRDTLVFKDGRTFDRYSHPQRLDGQVVGRVWSFRDVTEREKAQAEIHRLAFHDALTLLPNRRLLHDRLEQTMAACRRSGQNGVLMFLDLDNFKALNDVYGHGMGDLLLVEVAQRISGCVRQVDTVARFGGDEFVVMLGNLDADMDAAHGHVSRVAEKIRQALAQPYLLPNAQEVAGNTPVQHSCTASIGIATFPGEQVTADEILKRADIAMYRAKDAGSNAVSFYDAAAA